MNDNRHFKASFDEDEVPRDFGDAETNFEVETELRLETDTDSKAGSETSEPPVKNQETLLVELDYYQRVHFAFQQNGISLFHEAAVENLTSLEYRNLRIEITSSPEIFDPITLVLDRLAPGGRSRFVVSNTALRYAFLAQLSERLRGEIDVTVIQRMAEGREIVLTRKKYPVDVFAFDEWLGSEIMPSLLAAFVTPNLDVIDQLLSRTSKILTQKTGNGSVEGYQSNDKKRCYEIIQAAYEAVLENGIHYANPPASFGLNGQRIRFAGKILHDRLATCLDFSLLFASLLEQCGLHPLVMIQEGHAYVGCHLTDHSFGEAFFDDLQAIRKRVALDEIVVFETTVADETHRASFTTAESLAKKHLDSEDFIGALDVHQARMDQIRPIPLQRGKEGEWSINPVTEIRSDPSLSFVSSETREIRDSIEISDEKGNKSRLDHWKKKLLDLTKRNSLLSLKDSSKSISIQFSDPADLEDKLAADVTFQIFPAKSVATGDDPRDLNALEIKTGDDPRRSYLLSEFQKGRLHATPVLDEKELNKRLLAMYRQSQIDLQEGGVNTLFMTLGVVEWSDPKDPKILKAPLLLVPMKLDRKSVQEGFTLSRADEDTILNVTLLEMLRNDFGREIHGINPDALPTDASGIDVPKIFQVFQQELKDLSGCELKPEIYFGIFSFQKFVMWSDLNNHSDELLNNPIIDHLVNHAKEIFDDGIPTIEPKEIDRRFACGDILAPLSADSSQLCAILSAEKGKNFVLHGPPGTGKSQTITNIIAHCLYKGKTVLFVAEKRAALEVVYHRLSRLGLGAFCLELHSNKTGKQQVLDQFRAAKEIQNQSCPEEWERTARELEETKEALNEYVTELHRKYPNGHSVFDAISKIVASDSIQDEIRSVDDLTIPMMSAMSRDSFEELRKAGKEIESAVQWIPDGAWETFRGAESTEMGPIWEKETIKATEALRDYAKRLTDQTQALTSALGLKETVESLDGLNALRELGEKLRDTEGIPTGVYDGGWETTFEKGRRLIRLGKKRDEALSNLRSLHLDSVIPLLEKETSDRIASLIFVVEKEIRLSDPPSDGFPEWARDFREDLERISAVMNRFAESARSWLDALGISGENLDERAFYRLVDLFRLLREETPPTKKFIGEDWPLFAEKMGRVIVAGQQRDSRAEALRDCDLSSVMTFDTAKACQDWERAEKGFFLFRTLRRRGLVRQIQTFFHHSENSVEFEKIPALLETMTDYQTATRIVQEASALGAERFGDIWNSAFPDWDAISDRLTLGVRIAQIAESLAKRKENLGPVLKKTAALWSALDDPEASDGPEIGRFLDEWEAYGQNLKSLARLLTEVPLPDVGSRCGKTVAESVMDADASPTELSNTAIHLDHLMTALALYLSLHADYLALADDPDLRGRFFSPQNQGQPQNWDAWDKTLRHLDGLDQSAERLLSFFTPVSVGEPAFDAVSEMNPSSAFACGADSDIISDATGEMNSVRGPVPDIVVEPKSPSETSSALVTIREKIGQLLAPPNRTVRLRPLTAPIDEWAQVTEELKSRRQTLAELLVIRSPILSEDAPDYLRHCQILAQAILKHQGTLRYWSRWNEMKEKAAQLGLQTVIDAVSERKISTEKIAVAVNTRLYEAFVQQTVENVPVLKKFIGQERDKLIDEFQKLDKRYFQLTEKVIQARLTSRLPNSRGNGAPSGSEMGELQRELEKKKGHTAVRKLLDKIPTILPKLKPCLLMSPISVAQYLPLSREKYDMVIFDEASQIPVWDAIGAIARGNQLIVVGDPKQLPPTNFFQRQNEDDGASEKDVEEMESILSECQAARIHPIHLKWHYRSRHESLIAFSNNRYYNNNLYTFPSAHEKHPSLGVHFQFIENGCYDKNKSRQNRMEAQQVVRSVVKRLSDPRCSEKSLGIVTFNEAQKNLIEDLLETERLQHPEIDPFFSADRKEPVFVKNLENVQGDERDIMFFSIGYGPDSLKQVSMNFGPLNKQGGERRLNVAVTRAKEANIVFSSIHANQIDLARTKAVGAFHLREYLEYAEKGGVDEIKATSAAKMDYDSSFEEEVAEFLRGHGYEVHTQIGCANYRIDLGIVAPGFPGEYVVGIECDGACYHSSATARDRDILRQGVLEGLGWKICRVWSTSWFYEHDRAVEKLLGEIDVAFQEWEKSHSNNLGFESGGDTPSVAESSANGEKENFTTENLARMDDDESFLSTLNQTTAADDEETFDSSGEEVALEDSMENGVEMQNTDDQLPGGIPYPKIDYSQFPVFANHCGDNSIFYDPSMLRVIQEQMIFIIKMEGPITENLLKTRMKECWGFKKAGANIQEILSSCYPHRLAKTKQRGQSVFWDESMNPSDYRQFRTLSEDSDRRDIEDIPVQELVNAMASLTEEFGSFVENTDLFSQVGKSFGIRRITGQSRCYFEDALRMFRS